METGGAAAASAGERVTGVGGGETGKRGGGGVVVRVRRLEKGCEKAKGAGNGQWTMHNGQWVATGAGMGTTGRPAGLTTTRGVLPGRVLRLQSGCGAHGVYGGMWHFRRAGNQAGLTVCGIVIDMSGRGYAVWEEADLDVGMWRRVCAGCRGAVVDLDVKLINGIHESSRIGTNPVNRAEARSDSEKEKVVKGKGMQLGLFEE